MSGKLCIWFGFVSGAWVGLALGILRSVDLTGTPNWLPLSLDGLLVALITLLIAGTLACLVSRLSPLPVFVLALLIATPVGLLLGPLAYHLPHPFLSLVVCGILGLLIGWVICRLVCRDARLLDVEVQR